MYFHRLGTPQADDELVYERPDHPGWYLGIEVTNDQRYAMVYAQQGTDPNNDSGYAISSRPGNRWQELFGLGRCGLRRHRQRRFHVLCWRRRQRRNGAGSSRSNVERPEICANSSPRRRQASGGADDRRSFLCVLPQGCAFVGSHLRKGRQAGRRGAASGPGERRSALREARGSRRYFTFSSFTSPEMIYRYDAAANLATPHDVPKIAFDPSPYATEPDFAESKDGTRVPFFFTGRKDRPLDGRLPVSALRVRRLQRAAHAGVCPGRSPLWLEMGGGYAVANLRGGGEYGETWHEAGMRRAQAERLRRLHRRRRGADRRAGTRRRASWQSRVAATAACSWARC